MVKTAIKQEKGEVRGSVVDEDENALWSRDQQDGKAVRAKEVSTVVSACRTHTHREI